MTNPVKRGPYGLVGPDNLPMCEECDEQMHPFAHDNVEGYSCSGCGWSIDVPLNAPLTFEQNQNT